MYNPAPLCQSHSVTLSKCPEFWKFFTQRPLIGWNLRKRYPNTAYFVMAFVTERPPIFLPCIYMFVWGECCLKHGQKLENFVFSKQNRAIWGILSGANLIKVMKIKFHFYRLNRPICALYGWISLEDRDDTIPKYRHYDIAYCYIIVPNKSHTLCCRRKEASIFQAF